MCHSTVVFFAIDCTVLFDALNLKVYQSHAVLEAELVLLAAAQVLLVIDMDLVELLELEVVQALLEVLYFDFELVL